MLFLFTGTDREKARSEMNKAIAKSAGKHVRIVRITDASSMDDFSAALHDGGMFGVSDGDGKRVIVLDGVSANEEVWGRVEDALPATAESLDLFFMLEEKPNAETRRLLEKYAEKSERFDGAKKKKEAGMIFELASALKRGDKKRLWVGYQRALLRDEAPEAIHGVLFWGAKDMFMKSKGAERARAQRFLAELAELPHEARRNGFELEYALERYILGVVGAEPSRSINKS